MCAIVQNCIALSISIKCMGCLQPRKPWCARACTSEMWSRSWQQRTMSAVCPFVCPIKMVHAAVRCCRNVTRLVDDDIVACAVAHWISGSVYSRREAEESSARRQSDIERRDSLRADLNYTLVYLDIEIQGNAAGRMEFVLFNTESILAAENFRALCSCEHGPVPADRLSEAAKFGDGKEYCLKVRWSLYTCSKEGYQARSRCPCWRCQDYASTVTSVEHLGKRTVTQPRTF
jgi:hypothetical protein